MEAPRGAGRAATDLSCCATAVCLLARPRRFGEAAGDGRVAGGDGGSSHRSPLAENVDGALLGLRLERFASSAL
eukprot:706156-Alexandrium_andersonii.AAC.1